MHKASVVRGGKHMEQIVIQIGNSTGITLPKTVLEDLEVKPGDKISVTINTDYKTYTLNKGGKSTTSSITPHFFKVLERVNRAYGPALKELAGK